MLAHNMLVMTAIDFLLLIKISWCEMQTHNPYLSISRWMWVKMECIRRYTQEEGERKQREKKICRQWCSHCWEFYWSEYSNVHKSQSQITKWKRRKWQNFNNSVCANGRGCYMHTCTFTYADDHHYEWKELKNKANRCLTVNENINKFFFLHFFPCYFHKDVQISHPTFCYASFSHSFQHH